MKHLALIPARGGSVGVKRKNIAPLCGRPLIAYTIDAALQSKCFDRIIVSTDDDDIASIARDLGAETPFMRPPELSTGDVHPTSASVHALNWLRLYERYEPDGLTLLQPTSPLRTAQDIRDALELWERTGADCCVAVSEMRHANKYPFTLDALTHELRPVVHDQQDATRDADATELRYVSTSHDASAVDWVRSEPKRRQSGGTLYAAQGPLFSVSATDFLTPSRFPPGSPHPSFFSGRVCGYVMPESRCIDIDTPWDLHVAELLMRRENCTHARVSRYGETALWCMGCGALGREHSDDRVTWIHPGEAAP